MTRRRRPIWPAELGEQSWEHEGHPWKYTWVVKVIGGRPRVTHLAVEPSRYAGASAYLTTHTLSRVPIRDLVTAALRFDRGEFVQAVAATGRSIGRRGYGDDHWDQVWRLVRQAERQGVSPLTVLGLAMPDRSERTLKRWIRTARDQHPMKEEQ